MRNKLVLAALLPVCLSLHLAHAQSTFGDLRGITRDRGGQPVPGADVTVHSLDENTDRKLVSGNDGSFLMKNLQPGHYQLTAAKAGFQSSSAIDVELSARQSLRVDITLALEGQSGVVAVNAASEQVNTENAVIGDAKGTKQIGQLPVNYRAVSTRPLAAESTSATFGVLNAAQTGDGANRTGQVALRLDFDIERPFGRAAV